MEDGADDPMLPLGVLRTPQLFKTYALEIVIGVLEGSLFFIPAALVAAQGLSYVAAGFAAALGALMFVLVIPASGRALDRVGSRDVLLAGTISANRARCLRAGIHVAAVGLARDRRRGRRVRRAARCTDALHRHQRDPRSARATAVGLLSQALIVGQILGSSLAGGL